MVNATKEREAWDAVPGHPAIRRRWQWNAVHDYTRSRNVIEPATRLFIHISVTNPGNYRGNDAHAQAIERIGRSRFGTGSGNTGISYNFGVMPDASLYEFQPVSRRGAHTVNNYGISTCTRSGDGCPGRGESVTAPSGNLNYNARAIVICQNVDDPVTDAQIERIAQVAVCGYEAGFWTRHASHHPHGHRCVSGKSCPGNRMWARMWDLHDRIHHYLNNGLAGGGGRDDEEEEVRPSEWTDDDRSAVRDALLGALQFPQIVKVANGKQWNVAHVLSWLQRMRASDRDLLVQILTNQEAIMESEGVQVDTGALAQALAPLVVEPIVEELGDATGATPEQVEDRIEGVLTRMRLTTAADADTDS